MAAATVKSKPEEEIIELKFDDEDQVKVAGRGQRLRLEKKFARAEGQEGQGGDSSKGKGKGKKGQQRALLTAGEEDGAGGRPKEPKLAKQHMGEAWKKFQREGQRFKGVQDQKLNTMLKKTQRRDKDSVFQLVKNEVLQTADAGFLEAEGREKTFKFSQAAIAKEVTVGAAQKKFSFELPYGPYTCAFTSNGQHMLAAGRKGQVAMMHCDTMNITAELQLKETVRDVVALHNHTMFAVAQKKYSYIYDHNGVELHCMKDEKYQTHLTFLPYHYLLASAGDMADLHYRDISTGKQVVKMRTHLGPCRSIAHNPRNAVVHLGHSNGTVTMWTPNMKEPVVKMFAHAGHVTGMAVQGNHMVTTGADGAWKVWDLRNYESIQGFKCFGHVASGVDISMSGLVAVGYGSHFEVWKGALSSGDKPRRPYLTEEYPGKTVNSVKFRPYEDVCGVGLSSGFASVLIPGAGYANFDSFEANPFETKKQRREKEVRSLIEKLQPETIMLEPNKIGNIDKKVVAKYQEEVDKETKEKEAAEKKQLKKKMRGGKKAGNKLKRKQLRVGKDQRSKAKDRKEGEEQEDDDDDDDDEEGSGEEGAGSGADAGPEAAKKREAGTALGRFYGKRRRKT